MRILVWNIRAGGGRRVTSILAEVKRINPDICALSEFRGTPPSQWLAQELLALGFAQQRKAEGLPVSNTVFIASKKHLRTVSVRGQPSEPGRWLSTKVGEVSIAVVHIPNESTGRKDAFLNAVLDVARRWQNRPALILGDTNSGRPILDEENAVFDGRYSAWFDALESLGWVDMFRHLHGARREYTWYSPSGDNGFRLDQVFASRSMTAKAESFQHVWAGRDRRDEVSDHAALIATFAP